MISFCIDTLSKHGDYDRHNVISWTPWSDCSKTCGVGITERHSICKGEQPCGMTMHEFEECTIQRDCCKCKVVINSPELNSFSFFL